MIRATIHTDDHVSAAGFDATPWFEAAEDQDILDLAGCSWGNDLPADRVAYFLEDRPGYENATATLEDARRRKSGFEVSIQEKDATTWVLTNRPHLAAPLAEILGLEETEMIAWAERNAGQQAPDDEPGYPS